MPIYKYKKNLIAFIHIPKNAGKSIKEMLESKFSCIFFGYQRPYIPNKVTQQHYTYEELRKAFMHKLDIDKIYSFCVVRDPYDRIISEWKWQQQNKRFLDDSFEDFCKRVRQSLKTNKTYFDNHWRPQSDFISDKINRIIKFEKFNEEIKKVFSDINLEWEREILVRNMTNKKNICHTQLTKDIITDIYKIDFENFEYNVKGNY